jgi:hypothetical protein
MSWLFSSSCLREDVMSNDFIVGRGAIGFLGDFPPRARFLQLIHDHEKRATSRKIRSKVVILQIAHTGRRSQVQFELIIVVYMDAPPLFHLSASVFFASHKLFRVTSKYINLRWTFSWTRRVRFCTGENLGKYQVYYPNFFRGKSGVSCRIAKRTFKRRAARKSL